MCINYTHDLVVDEFIGGLSNPLVDLSLTFFDVNLSSGYKKIILIKLNKRHNKTQEM